MRINNCFLLGRPRGRVTHIIHTVDSWVYYSRLSSPWRRVFVAREGRLLHKLVFDRDGYWVYLVNNRLIDQGDFQVDLNWRNS